MLGRAKVILVLLMILMFATPHLPTNCKQSVNFVPHKKTTHAIFNKFCFELVFKPKTITDATYTFIFKEDTPLIFFTEIYMNGLGSAGLIYTRLACVIPYAVMVCLRYFTSCFPRAYSSCRRHKLNMVRLRHYKRLRRRYLSLRRRLLWVHVVVLPLFILLLLCGDVHPHPGPGLPHSRRHPRFRRLVVASWNVRTLLESKRTTVRPSAIVSRELARYNIDIAALSETRMLGENMFEEVGAGYTFFLKGNPLDGKCYHGVGFAIRTELLFLLQGKYPTGINERLMKMSLSLDDCTVSMISAYAPTLGQSDENKGCFYDSLDDIIKAIPSSHKLLLLGDFNARVGTDYSSWEGIIGKHGVGNENSNGTRLLTLCSQNGLCLTNTLFQQPTRRKLTWMHPGSKVWHMIDFVITRQRDVKDVNHTRAMLGSCAHSDHRLVKSNLCLRVKKPQLRHRIRAKGKLDVAKLKSVEIRTSLAQKLQEAYDATDMSQETVTASWNTFKDITLKVAEDVLGHPDRKHRDWFDENDPLIKPLLDQLHTLRIESVEDSDNAVKADAYRVSKQETQKSLRTMQNKWWLDRAIELQEAADRRDFKAFYQGLKAVHGPKHVANPSIKSKDGVLLTEPAEVLNRWSEHFKGVLNQNSNFDMSVLDDIPQQEVNMALAELPTLDEVLVCIKQLTTGKSPGEDGIPPEVYKHGGRAVAEQLLALFIQTWQGGTVTQEFRDATIVHLYKNKGDRGCCDNHRGISLLCIASKILARLVLNRLIKHIDRIDLIPESQCGFRPSRGTTDMVFSLRQLQEKCYLHGEDLYFLFIDLTKAFDTVNREGLWLILERVGCPKHFVDIIRSFHDDMKATVREGSDRSPAFDVTSGTKQGCVLAPTLFSIFFSAMLHVAFKDATEGVDVKSRLDRGLCSTNTKHFSATSKLTLTTIRDLLFADDCALAASSLESLQSLCDRFSVAARRFGLIISIKKTESLYQPAPGNDYIPPVVLIEGNQLKDVDTFKYLGSVISNTADLGAEIRGRISKATAAFGRLSKRLWNNRNIRLGTKVAVYRAAVLTSLLYSCETWTLKREHIKSLEKFHQSSLRKIARIKWTHKVTNYEVLARCKIGTIQSMVDKACLRWTGHVVRMKDHRIPKVLLYGRLTSGRSRGGNHKTYLNNIKSTLRASGINPHRLEDLACSRNRWRATTKEGIKRAEADRINRLISKRERRKARADLAPQPT